MATDDYIDKIRYFNDLRQAKIMCSTHDGLDEGGSFFIVSVDFL